MNVLDLVKNNLSEGVIDTLMSQVGSQDKQKTTAAANGIMSTVMGALAKNASTPEGRASLNRALEKDHDGSILDDVMGLVQGKTSVASDRATNGAGILKHILGDKQDSAADLISTMSGMDKNSTASMMIKMAPMIMGALGKQKRQAGLDENGIADLLSKTVQSETQSKSEMSIIEKFLDQDNDGSVMDDLLRMGGNALSSFLKK